MNKNTTELLKTKPLKNFQYGSYTDVGCVREVNQDTYNYSYGINGDLFVVCDGMGGTDLGADAARIAVESISQTFTGEWKDDPKALIKEAIQKANKVVFDFAETRGKSAGTTVALVLVRDSNMWYAHVGDSRIYYQSGKRFFPLTEDHSLVQTMVRRGLITPQEARIHHERHIVTRALGLQEDVEADISDEALQPGNGDIVLLCTDGLTNELDEEAIEDIIAGEQSPQEKAEKLTEQAKSFGGSDNITVQLVSFFNDSVSNYQPRKKNKQNTVRIRTRLQKTTISVLAFILVLALAYFFRYDWFTEDKPAKLRKDLNSTCVISAEKDIFKDNASENLAFVAGPDDCFIIYKDLFGLTEAELMRINNRKRLFFEAGELILIPKTKSE
jgi:serine/threonine protein phosphatase PrpC